MCTPYCFQIVVKSLIKKTQIILFKYAILLFKDVYKFRNKVEERESKERGLLLLQANYSDNGKVRISKYFLFS